MIEKTFLSKDERSTVHYYIWEPVGRPRAVLQIVHGMAEHLLRYADFAEYLNSKGILVCGNDHIGHGRSADPKDWGYFGEEDGWKIMVQDVEQLHGIMKVQYMDIPYFILGHSMGSFITRAWLAMVGRGIDGAIIMGTSGSNPAVGVAKTLVSTLRRTQGSRHISKTITGMAFGSYNKRIKPRRTDFDWLTRDNDIVDKYIDDPACGFTFTLAGYSDLFNVIAYVSSDNWYKLVPKDLPLLLVSGTEDPVGAYGKGPAEVAEKLENAGCGDVSMILYEDMRHEILNEFGKETVYNDLRSFILDEEIPDMQEYDEAAKAEILAQAEDPEENAQPEPAEKEPLITAEPAAPVIQPEVSAEVQAEPSEEAPAEVFPVNELNIPDFDAAVREEEPAASVSTGLGDYAEGIIATAAAGAAAVQAAEAEPQPEKTGLSDADSDMITNMVFNSQNESSNETAEEEPSREFNFPEFTREEPRTDLEKVVDSYKAMGAQIEYVSSEAADADKEAEAPETVVDAVCAEEAAETEAEQIDVTPQEVIEDKTETTERSTAMTDLDERVYHDLTPQDDRLSEERAFDHAEDATLPSPDFSGIEEEDVPHRGIRNVHVDHTAEWLSGDKIHGRAEAVEEPEEEDPNSHYVQDLYKHMNDDHSLTVHEAAFHAAREDYEVAPHFWEEEKGPVVHRGIRWLVEGYDAEWNAAHPTVGPARGVIKRASEKAEELAARYDAPDTSKRIADKAEALAEKYNG